MIINNIEFDEPDPKNFPIHLYFKMDEGKRTHIQGIWVDEFIRLDSEHTEYAAHTITLSNYGSATIDNKPVKDPKELEWIRRFFDDLKLNKER